ncbi:hypothetical protein GCM10010174_41030 [Kutzneria viridogrisea]|uniref:DUF4180 domain-containing protein n=1 Tax=Kutzneria viridogrisea TaxID=47990 RepID=A0ABR6BN87_9PSEU|nr:hypothetical protein [Kutzneria viridogrisea]
MSETKRQVYVHPAEGPVLASEAEAVELIGELYPVRPDVLVIPVSRLDERFFTLSTRLAGEMLQKFVLYGLHVVILGDISEHVARSTALRDFVHESNEGRHVWFLADLPALEARLAAR